MRAARFNTQRNPLSLEEVSVPVPGPHEILIKVKACGICHSDLHLFDGDWNFNLTPRIPGHEVAGIVATAGSQVKGFREGDPVGLSWIHSFCKKCPACKREDTALCERQEITGVTVDGGYAEYVKAPASSCIKLPPALSPEQTAPLMCAGLTAYAGLKLARIKKGERVAIHGLGGVGHLAIQIAKHQGARVVTLTRSKEKGDFALKLGSDDVINLAEKDAVSGLNELDGADVIFSSSIMPTSLGRLIPALRPNGRLIVVGGGRGTFQVNPVDLIAKRIQIIGSPVGSQKDLADVVRLAEEGKIHPVIETYPIEKVNDALTRMRYGKVRFRAVLTF